MMNSFAFFVVAWLLCMAPCSQGRTLFQDTSGSEEAAALVAPPPQFVARTDAELAELVAQIPADGILPQDLYDTVRITGAVTSVDPLNEKLRSYNGTLLIDDTTALTEANLGNLQVRATQQNMVLTKESHH